MSTRAPTTVLDPGHGGRASAGKSTPEGVRGPGGTAEKTVTLALASGVKALLPGEVVLTRRGDENLTLAARAAVARRLGAATFVSIHANAGPPGERGCEVWVHPRSGPASRALAGAVRAELAALGMRDRGLREGAIATLDPGAVGPAAAACLVEVDFLSDPAGERLLTDPAQVRRISEALARAIRSSRPRAGFGAGEEEEFDEPSIEGPIPEDEAGVAAQGLAQGQSPQYPRATQFLPARTGHFRVPASARTISKIVIHITDGTTLSGATGWFQSAGNTGQTSAHYVVGQDGTVVQMVRHEDIAHHAGTANPISIGIEHVALSPAGAASLSKQTGKKYRPLYPTDDQYRASADLVVWLCETLGIPVDRDHIVGHSEAAKTSHSGCPNSVWDWFKYEGLLGIKQLGDYELPPSHRAYAGRR